MLWGPCNKAYMDHKNLVRDALGLSSDNVHLWRLLQEECNPEIVYVKGVDNTIADTISHLKYDPDVNARGSYLNAHRVRNGALIKLLTDYNPQDCHHGGQSCLGVYMDMSASDFNLESKYDLNHIFATIEQEE